MLPDLKASSETYIPGSKTWRPEKNTFAIQPGSCQIYDQTEFHKVKGIDNAFDLMQLCLVLLAEAYRFQELTFTKEFKGTKFLLPTFSSGGR